MTRIEINPVVDRMLKKFCLQRELNPGISHPRHGTPTIEPQATFHTRIVLTHFSTTLEYLELLLQRLHVDLLANGFGNHSCCSLYDESPKLFIFCKETLEDNNFFIEIVVTNPTQKPNT